MSDTSEIENRLAKITIAGSDGVPWTVLSGDLGGALCQANADIRTLLDRLSSSERRVKSLEETVSQMRRGNAQQVDCAGRRIQELESVVRSLARRPHQGRDEMSDERNDEDAVFKRILAIIEGQDWTEGRTTEGEKNIAWMAMRAALAEQREADAAICTKLLDAITGVQIEHVSAERYATDCIRDIRDAILSQS